jgi:uncharacterized membrane protein YkvA (DUF1232 family)
MSNGKNVSPQQVGFLKSLLNHLRLVSRLLRDPRVPIYLKAIPFAPLVYLISPIDFLPDLIPIIGQLDDLALVLLGVETFIALCPQDVVEEHRAALRGDLPYTASSANTSGARRSETIDGEYRVKK